MIENEKYLTDQIITYIGNKRSLLEFIGQGIDIVKKDLDKDKLAVFDGFAGSGIVSRYFKQHSSYLISNDFEYYSYVINKTYLTNKKDLDFGYIKEITDELNRLKLRTDLGMGIIEKLYAPKDDNNIQDGERTFYTNCNAKIIDNIRRTIDLIVLNEDYRDIFLSTLMTKASVHVNTGGVFKGFYKNKEGIGEFGGTGKNALVRILGEIELPIPILSNFDCDNEVYNEDTNQLIHKLGRKMDVTYYDPPYNQHPYGSNYFMLNLIYRYEEPKIISKVSGIPDDWQRSNYNKKEAAKKSLNDLIRDTPSTFILLSYNNEGIIPHDTVVAIMSQYGSLTVLQQQYNTYKASRNLKDRENKVSEILYVLKK